MTYFTRLTLRDGRPIASMQHETLGLGKGFRKRGFNGGMFVKGVLCRKLVSD